MKFATTYNGDKIDSISVITKLNVNDLERGRVYRFMFKGADMNIGQSWYVPLMVAVGDTPGPKLLLNTGIHGDEINGSRVIQQLFEKLDPKTLSGVVIGVLQSNPNALMHGHRKWHLANDGGEYIDMNRVFPGNNEGNAAEIHAYKLWHDLWFDNANYVIDIHTNTTDALFQTFIYADYTNPMVKQMAELIPVNHIKVDSPDNVKTDNGGSLSKAVDNVFNAHGIPALTLELGGARSYNQSAINIALEGINNIMIDRQMIKGIISKTAKDVNAYIGRDMHSVDALRGGYTEILVKLGELITQGQLVARQRNPFGDIIHNYTAPLTGVIAAVATGAIREQGSSLVYILS
jgi:predicted deacylase